MLFLHTHIHTKINAFLNQIRVFGLKCGAVGLKCGMSNHRNARTNTSRIFGVCFSLDDPEEKIFKKKKQAFEIQCYFSLANQLIQRDREKKEMKSL